MIFALFRCFFLLCAIYFIIRALLEFKNRRLQYRIFSAAQRQKRLRKNGKPNTYNLPRFVHTSDPPLDKYPRLSRPVPSMKPEYDVVVIGSGYGGGVAASRMARAGKSVAVLELGSERWPGEYPSNLKEVAPEFHVSGNTKSGYTRWNGGILGKKTGLYHLIEGEGQNAFVANGLGGTSLVNGNVFLRTDYRTLALSHWPDEIRHNPSSLDQYFNRAENMLQPTPLPKNHPIPRKLAIFEGQAKALDQHRNFYRAPLTTFFHHGLNNVGVEMNASTGSGQDCTGINDGSKNSVLMTYLPDAWNWGAEIFCECEVRYICKDPKRDGYLVFYAWHDNGRTKFKNVFHDQLMWVRAKELCFLGAGAIGTSEILLRSQAHGLSTSSLVGQKLSGNGDMLSFAYNSDKSINGVGSEKPYAQGPSGPTITGVIDNRGTEAAPNVLDSHVIQEGAIPEALAPVIQGLLEAHDDRRFPILNDVLNKTLSRLKGFLFGPYTKGSSVNKTQSYLVMSHDSGEGTLTLKDDRPNVQFIGVDKSSNVSRLRSTLKQATDAIGGTLIHSPSVTVHPLGGARMSFDGTGRSGAVNHLGQLFVGEGSEVYDGLLCVDGSIIPASLGVNPFATITALAERSCDLIAKQMGCKFDETPNGPLNLFGSPSKSCLLDPDLKANSHNVTSAEHTDGVQFTEIMEGSIHVGNDIDDFIFAEKVANGAASTARLYLSVHIADVERVIQQAGHTEPISGTFSCGALSQNPLLIERGTVKFFNRDKSVADGIKLEYDLTVRSTQGEVYVLKGYKTVGPSTTLSPLKTWRATTTLYTTISSESGSLVGKGILRISPRNFTYQLRTFRGTGIWRFITFFVKNALQYFVGPFRTLEPPNTSITEYYPKPAPTTMTLIAYDGVRTQLKIWEPLPNAPHRNMPILFLPGASVDDQIFSLPTVSTNAIDYFTSLGFRCYVAVMRFGINPAAEEGWTAYDTRFDVKAAMEYVREKEGGRKFYVVCHCLGSITTSIALLTGIVKAEWIQGMTVSQVFCDLRFSKDNQFKAEHPFLLKLYKKFAADWFPCNTPSPPSFSQWLIDQILRFYPVGSAAEFCASSTCHRCSLPFGRCFTHANLNHATHKYLASYFSGIHMRFLSHLSRMGATAPHHVRSNEEYDFTDLVSQKGNLERLQGIKIQFLSGGANVVFDPLSTLTTYDMLRRKFEVDDYERVVVKGYGHLDTWMGKDSWRDVYPRVKGHVELCEKLEASDENEAENTLLNGPWFGRRK